MQTRASTVYISMLINMSIGVCVHTHHPHHLPPLTYTTTMSCMLHVHVHVTTCMLHVPLE